MSKFDFMFFDAGHTFYDEFVAHAKKFTKEETLELLQFEGFEGGVLAGSDLSIYSENDIKKRFVKYYVRCPDWCAFKSDGGCYTYCEEGARGSFPVWVISLRKE